MSRDRVLMLVDLVVVLTLAGTALAQVWAESPGELDNGRAVHSVLVVGFTVPLLMRRRFAALVFVTIVASAWLQLELGGELGQPFFAALLGWYSLGAHASAPTTYLGPAGVGLLIVLVDIPRLRDGAPADEVVPAWFILLVIWSFGRWMRRRSTESADLRERAVAAEREQREQAQGAVAEERARIARELHDLVAHSMGVIVIQAQGAQRALDSSPERSREALASIESTSRQGMAEMRRLLGLLTEAGDDGDTTSPQPGLKQISELVERVRATGLRVDLAVEGEVRPLPPGLELTGYRIVQEAMTNVLKHAGPTTVDVRVRYEADSLGIDVRDYGRGVPDETTVGHGLVGMRERVGLYGGTVLTGPLPEGGFSVRARIPVNGVAS